MNILFFDIETNGLAKVQYGSYQDLDNWPRLVQIAWILTDADGGIISQAAHLIQPDKWQIPVKEFWIKHGFSTKKSLLEGVPIYPVLEEFIEAKKEADILVSHNLSFDHGVVWSEILRAGLTPKTGMKKFCTMKNSVDLVKTRRSNGMGYGWPKLSELHEHLFGQPPSQSHDAMADVRCVYRCFFRMLYLGLIDITKITTKMNKQE